MCCFGYNPGGANVQPAAQCQILFDVLQVLDLDRLIKPAVSAVLDDESTGSAALWNCLSEVIDRGKTWLHQLSLCSLAGLFCLEVLLCLQDSPDNSKQAQKRIARGTS